MSLQAPLRPVPHVSKACRQCLSRLRTAQHSPQSIRSVHFNNTPSLVNVSGQHDDDTAKSVPRWAATPSAMKAPYRLRPRNDNDTFPVNENPERLDEMYISLLGPGGETWLTEDVKWLAVTHKSFDLGRRGFNERLAWLGRRMVNLQACYALLNHPPLPEVDAARKRKDLYSRRPFQDPALHGIEDVSYSTMSTILDESRICQMAQTRYGLQDVIRWKPKQIHQLKASGLHSITAEALYAIIGAVALSKGGEVANLVIRDKVLTPLMGVAPP